MACECEKKMAAKLDKLQRRRQDLETELSYLDIEITELEDKLDKGD